MLSGRSATAAVMKLTVVRLTAPSVTGPVDSHMPATASKAEPAARLGPSVSVPGENASGNDTPPVARHGPAATS